MHTSKILRSLAVFGLVLVVAGFLGLLITGGFSSASNSDAGGKALGAALYLAPDGSDDSPCSKARPCASFDRAYQVASPGSTVVVTCPGSSCSYPDQTIASSSAKPLKYRCRWGAAFQDGTVAQDLSGCIHFQPDQGKTVTVSNVSINAPYVYLDGFTLAGARGNDGEVIVQNQPAGGPCLVPNSYTDIIVRNVNAYNFFIKGTAYLSFVDDVFDGQYALSNTVTQCGQSPLPYDTNHVLFDGVTVKNVYWDAAGEHVEGIHWWDGDQVLITNSRFLNDAQFDINFDGDRGNLTHITVQNTIFDDTCSHQNFAGGCNGNNGQHALSMNNRDTHFQTAHNVFAYNSFPLDDWPSFTSAGNMSDIRVYGSVMEGPQNQYTCDSFTSIGVSFDHNIFDTNQITPTPCGTTNSTANNPANLYTNPANYDYSLKRGSRAIAFVPINLPRPITDINGQPRPHRFRADAGAAQWDSARVVLGRSIGRIRIGEPVKDVLGFYGKPRTRTAVAVEQRRLERLNFPLHRGLLWALLDRGSVVGVGTTSPYYTTQRGVGVTGNVSATRVLGLSWVACRNALSRDFGGVRVFVTPTGGRRGSRIASLVMVKSTYGFGACKP